MPAERDQSANPTGRQKSCARCVRSKRRCDLTQPSCLRCVRQHFTCSYPPRPTHNLTLVPEDDSPMPDGNIDSAASALDMSLIRGLQETPVNSRQDTCLLDFDLNAGLESVGFLHDLLNTSPMPEIEQREGSLVRSTHIRQARSTRLPQVKACEWELTPASYARISYAIDRMKEAPATMVLENQTPWSHPLLYEDCMPRVLQEAHATCALYLARNETNSAFFARHVIDRVKEVTSSPPPTAPVDILARAHALILYQVMQAFSGDLQLYAHVGPTFPHLEESIYALYTTLQEAEDPPYPALLSLYPAATAREVWCAFILRESSQRTLLTLCQFLVLLHLLQGRSYCVNHAAVTSKITTSAHLWHASSTIEFASAWNEKRHFLVADLDFTEVLEGAGPEDIDVFGRMILVTILGRDDMLGWFAERGGVF
ncbi:hypothetical protein BU16DRAFT_499719 [Lophium mytilinum]|uniref:Zn(2)-C6 fungal-type domain-containing protein n=1 Tax=Lophium mytilinum TaxID=390894 RepID=A0A6A6R854_9PEZI|nr:hypothetical protein BU16DRAFT_499719 [Lophium mytilinum]